MEIREILSKKYYIDWKPQHSAWNKEPKTNDYLVNMYQEYIEGKKELREINMEFNARYVKDMDMETRGGSCVM